MEEVKSHKMESRIEILNRLAKKFSHGKPNCIPVDTFEDWLMFYDSAATIILVRAAMGIYSTQELKNNDKT